jgi:hypothetical protein
MIFQRVKNERFIFLIKLLLCFLAGILSAYFVIHLFF